MSPETLKVNTDPEPDEVAVLGGMRLALAGRLSPSESTSAVVLAHLDLIFELIFIFMG